MLTIQKIGLNQEEQDIKVLNRHLTTSEHLQDQEELVQILCMLETESFDQRGLLVDLEEAEVAQFQTVHKCRFKVKKGVFYE